jgi:hypothetical protein
VIDHERARRILASSLDFPADPSEAEALDAHLRACPSCRAFEAGLRTDAAVLREVELGPVPVAVRANLAIASERGRRGGGVGRWIAIAAVGALLLVGLGAGSLGFGSSAVEHGRLDGAGDGAGPAAGAPQVAWQTKVVSLTAMDFSILAGGKTFRGVAPIEVSSDPGDATYRTLEATWHEHGVEMRLNLYFDGDAGTWWVNEIRVYDGTANPGWLYARGTFFKTALGGTWSGDIDIPMTDADVAGRLPASVHFGGLTLASGRFDGVNEPFGGGIAVPPNARPFAVGGTLHCSGILQMTPKQAEATLLKLGYRLSWRLDRTTGPNTGYAEAMKDAPDGVLHDEPLPGTDGELIMFVAPFGDPQAVPVPFPADCPASAPNGPSSSPAS